jgi:hypothetical protein
VKNKRERSLPVRPLGVEKTSRLGSRDPVERGQVRAAWWQERQDEVKDGFLVEPYVTSLMFILLMTSPSLNNQE